jgi:hypothetical protein
MAKPKAKEKKPGRRFDLWLGKILNRLLAAFISISRDYRIWLDERSRFFNIHFGEGSARLITLICVSHRYQ